MQALQSAHDWDRVGALKKLGFAEALDGSLQVAIDEEHFNVVERCRDFTMFFHSAPSEYREQKVETASSKRSSFPRAIPMF
jgi:sulfur relay (sulfurtransferase) DsrC/TusE family protein